MVCGDARIALRLEQFGTMCSLWGAGVKSRTPNRTTNCHNAFYGGNGAQLLYTTILQREHTHRQTQTHTQTQKETVIVFSVILVHGSR